MDIDRTRQDALDIDQLIELVAEITGADLITPESNFFDLGGDSLTAAHLSLLIEERFEVGLDVFAIYAAEDIREIHQALAESAASMASIAA